MITKAPPSWSRRLLGLALLGPVLGAFAQPLAGQNPTAEGTTIRNTATVTFTDARSNSYSSVEAWVEVTVGFQAGIDVAAGAATATPASPSTDNELDFVITNDGNGTDQVSVGTTITDGNVINNVRYEVGGTEYASLVLLNTALATTDILAGDPLTVTVRYNVLTGQGGTPSTLTVTATSVRDVGVSDSDNTVVTPPLTGTITVTPDGGQNLEHLPTNGGAPYTAQFSVTSGLSGTDDIDLIASTQNANLTIVSVNGVLGSSTQLSFTSGQNQTIDVVYTVNDVASGSTDELRLLARSVSTPAVDNLGFFDITVVRPIIAVTKQAWNDARDTEISGGTVLPGQWIQYRISVENTGLADATSISVSDALHAQVTYGSHSDDGGTPAWVIGEAAGTVTGTLATLAVGATRFFWIRVQIK